MAEKVGSECLIPLMWTGPDLEAIPFDNLPSRDVMKAPHGSGHNIIVTDNSTLDRASAKRKLRTWRWT